MRVDQSSLLFLMMWMSTGSVHSVIPIPWCLEAAASRRPRDYGYPGFLVTSGLVRGFLELCTIGYKCVAFGEQTVYTLKSISR